uniref:RING-type E3 ubiquitin transferase n=1 Tax=Fagus sylvatica TaxID=28930 RepID=A0A2N9H1T4_FAGSY
MSEGQASELKELESTYEKVVDENCRLLVKYFKEVLENKDENKLINLPPFTLRNSEKVDTFEYSEDEKIEKEDLVLQNGRYNVIQYGLKERGQLNFTARVAPANPSLKHFILKESLLRKSFRRLIESPSPSMDSELDSSLEDNSAYYSSSSESEAKVQEKNKRTAVLEPRQSQIQKQKEKQPISAESSSSVTGSLMADFDNLRGGGKHTPPKDFVCPITSNIFDDPVTLETGQTYERRAILEWMDRGNSTCPITRQKLHSIQLPKTNYVLKRLIASWQEHNPISVPNQYENPHSELEPIMKPIRPSTSPNSVIGKATIDGTISELRHAITNLCMSEVLEESEMAVIQIKRFWHEAYMDVDIKTMISRPPVINGFMEILFNSVDPHVLKATIFLLSEMGSTDKDVIQTLTRVDYDVECIVALFKKGLVEAVVLIYLLRPSTVSLADMDMVNSLIKVIKKKEEDLLKMCLKPKTASVLLLGQILVSSEESIGSSIANTVISEKAIESIVGSLEAEWAEERIATVGILLRCMQEDGKCRNTIANKAELAPLLECFMGAGDGERFEIVHFLSELIKLNRMEGSFNTMHTLLVYLQNALQDQCPVVAGLLLQLDLLVEPRKMSIYREEAMDTLISCLRNSEFPTAQIEAAETIVSLQGSFSASGKPLTRAFLLKRAGLDKSYQTLMRMEQLRNIPREFEETMQWEEEKAADDWERKMAFVLVSHEFGLLFEALAEGLKSRYAELRSACFVSATWLIHMLSILPDTGIRGAARVCLLKHFISIFKSAKDTEDKALSLLALNTFIHDPEGLQDLNFCMKEIMKGLRELKKSLPLAFEMLKVFSKGHDSSSQDFWNHKELAQVDCSENGEVLSIVFFKDKIFSGHSDGIIKVWTGRGSILHLMQEVREHTKAVTSLAIFQSGERLYSGSLDRTTRVWSVNDDEMHCIQALEMKDQVHNLVVAKGILSYIPQGAGVKVHLSNGGSKLLNSSKYVKCLALVHGKLYCGCHDNSIQEIDLATETLGSIQGGSRKLLGKSNPVNALQVHNGVIYSASSSLDGAAVKIWDSSDYSMLGSLPTMLDVRAMAISSELIYLGGKGGTVEIWG